jgi:multiple sugar transport system ATP-binding protein
MARIGLDDVSKKYRAVAAVEALDLDVGDGEFFVLLGPTGAGKTTTLRLIAGLEKPDSGRILIDGQVVNDWGAAERDVALVLQQYSLYPRYTVRQNLEFPLKSRIRNYSPSEIAERIDQAARTLRIGHLLERKTERLSGGEMQRVSIGRAIVREPHVFLMDEPLSNLDAKLREALRSELKDLQVKLGATFIFVTHDQVEAMSMADRVGVLNRGRLIQQGRPQEIYNNPRNTFVASFIGSPAINLLDGRLERNKAVLADGAVSLPMRAAQVRDAEGAGSAFTFGIRPEDIELKSGAAAEASVHEVEDHGVEQIVTLRAGDTLLRATVPGRAKFSMEETVRFSWNPDKVLLFDAQSGMNLAQAG